MAGETEFTNRVRDGKVFFFAGSGISFLSNLPSAGRVLCNTAAWCLPDQDDYKALRQAVVVDESSYKIQPEVFYETLLYVVRSTDALLFWKSVSTSYLKSFGYPVEPNINHLAIVDYAVKTRMPILTTNFDSLFEEAAEQLGYNHQVLLPRTDDERTIIECFNRRAIRTDTAYIFKLHGSISTSGEESLDSLCTTMTSISRANFRVIDFLEWLCKANHIVFVGYSGRDIDYFPEIKRRSLVRRPFWIDRFRDTATRANCDYIHAIPVTAYPNEIFERERPELIRRPVNVPADLVNRLFWSLQEEISRRIALTDDEKKLLLGLLLRQVQNS